MLKTIYIPAYTTISTSVNCTKLIKCGDTLKLLIKVFDDGGVLADLTGQTIDLILKKSDNTLIEKTITSIEDGTITATMDVQATNVAGVVRGEIQISDSTGQSSTNTFTFIVSQSIANDVLEASINDIQVLTDFKNAVTEYSNIAITIAGTAESVEALANIKSYIDTNLPNLESKNSEAVINAVNLTAQNTTATTNISELETQNANASANLADFEAIDTNNIVSQLSEMAKGLNINVVFPPIGITPIVMDGTNNDGATINACIQYIKNSTAGKGVIKLPSGTLYTSEIIELESNITLQGDGLTNTYIKALPTLVLTNDQGVVQTNGYDSTVNQWNYYPPYPSIVKMGVGIRDLTVDANRTSLTTGNGICLYAGKITMDRVGIINAPNHCLVTMCGTPISSTSGDDLHDFINMHESMFNHIYISNANNRGWEYLGPNDSNINHVQIKCCGGSGFVGESNGYSMPSTLKIGSMHAYACCNNLANTDTFMVNLSTQCDIDKLYIDSSNKGGLTIVSSKNTINQIHLLNPNPTRVTAYSGINIDQGSEGNYIGHILAEDTVVSATGTNVGDILLISGSNNIIDGVTFYLVDSATVRQSGIKLSTGVGNYINSGIIKGASLNTLSRGLYISTSRNYVNLEIVSCYIGLSYNNGTDITGDLVGNEINIKASSVTTLMTQTFSHIEKSKVTIYDLTNALVKQYGSIDSYDARSRQLLKVGTTFASAMSFDTSICASFQEILMTSNFTLAFTNSLSLTGKELFIKVTNNGASSYTITFDSNIVLTSGTNTATVASGATVIYHFLTISATGIYQV